jgi:hypothetical protein
VFVGDLAAKFGDESFARERHVRVPDFTLGSAQ